MSSGVANTLHKAKLTFFICFVCVVGTMFILHGPLRRHARGYYNYNTTAWTIPDANMKISASRNGTPAHLVILPPGYTRGYDNHNTTAWTIPDANIKINASRNGTPAHLVILPPCPEKPPGLVGAVKVDLKPRPWADLNTSHTDIHVGGWHQPDHCVSRHHVAIVIPYRNRDGHLRVFLHHMIPILNRQQLHYRIFVIKQSSRSRFNRGMLMNIGFVEALKTSNFTCTVFSDVDLLPENDRNIYGCPLSPKHMLTGINKFDYRLPYATNFGGVENFLAEHYRRINGYSNVYFGWGAEDDDLYYRVKAKGFKVIRPPKQIGLYTAIRHQRLEPVNRQRLKLLKKWKSRMATDGLNSLNYTVTNYTNETLYTSIDVDI